MDLTAAENGTRLRRLLISRVGPVMTISLAQLFGTSLWFSANGISDALQLEWHTRTEDIGWLTSAVQLGFIFGTLIISLFGIADRYKASRLFVLSALSGAALNVGFACLASGLISGAMFRFGVGICLAGIYPMGMKLIVSWVPEKAGFALSILVAMLTLGTALPHALRVAGEDVPWQCVITASSALALLSAAIIGTLGDGPYRAPTTANQATKPSAALFSAFKIPAFRAASLGYFGHMWELYTFWTLIPLLIVHTSLSTYVSQLGVPIMAFCLIGIGALGSVAGGVLSLRIGSEKVAMLALALSGLCCLIFVTCWKTMLPLPLFTLLLVWGTSVVADSPQFSTLTARSCPAESVGGALAIQNSLGYSLTVISIAMTTTLYEHFGPVAMSLLLPGPLFGLCSFCLYHRQKV